jgi:hypothetical protein
MAIASFPMGSEFVGPQQRRDHQDGDEHRRRRIDELDDHAQILLSA